MASIFKSIANTLNPPGSGLVGREKTAFENIKAVVDRSTHDMLIRPDWEANIECVDLANGERSQSVLREMAVLLQRKLQSRTPKVVVMTLTLAETLVKNGTTFVHGALGNDLFMSEMAAVARKYHKLPGADNREVADLCLDIIQAWGEGFMSKQNQFPAFTKYYFELRKEGLPFNQEFDASKMPDFAPPVNRGGSNNPNQMAEDEALAAALAASISTLSYQDGPNTSSSNNAYYDNPPPPPQGLHSATSVRVIKVSNADLINSVNAQVTLLQEMVAASSGPAELRSNDIAYEVSQQVRSYISRLLQAIDDAATNEPEAVEGLFKAHGDAVQAVQVYEDMKGGPGVTVSPPSSSYVAPSSTATSKPAANKSTQQSTTTTVTPLLDLADDVSNPLLMQASSSSTPAAPLSVARPITVTTPSLSPRTVSPPRRGPPTVDISPTVVNDPFTTKPSASDDPFGGSSSIDVLLGPDTKVNNTTQVKKNDANADILSLFTTPAAPAQPATQYADYGVYGMVSPLPHQMPPAPLTQQTSMSYNTQPSTQTIPPSLQQPSNVPANQYADYGVYGLVSPVQGRMPVPPTAAQSNNTNTQQPPYNPQYQSF